MLRPIEAVISLIARGYDGHATDDEFERVALAAHEYQRATNPVVASLSSRETNVWKEIPLLSTDLFARHHVACFEPDRAVRAFLSSGTTRENRGRHLYDDLALYRAASISGARYALGEGSWRCESLVPDAPDSSLACMAGWMREEWPARPCDLETPVVLIGTAFSFVPLIDSGARRPLPHGSIVIETGGYKGRSREMPRDELRAGIAAVYGLPRERVIGEYGMCEISTPLWERPGVSGYAPPPWMRIRILDPETLRDLESGATGVIGIIDLANLHSSIGILTADLGRVENGRLIIERRLPDAVAKGCSLSSDENDKASAQQPQCQRGEIAQL